MAALKEWEEASTPCPLWLTLPTTGERVQELFRKYGKAFAVVELQDDDLGDRLLIERMESPEPKSGAGTSLLSFLKGLATKHGIRIELVACPYPPSMPQPAGTILTEKELVSWYEKRGFVKKTWGMPTMWYPDFPTELVNEK
jgi:hypothetical protein